MAVLRMPGADQGQPFGSRCAPPAARPRHDGGGARHRPRGGRQPHWRPEGGRRSRRSRRAGRSGPVGGSDLCGRPAGAWLGRAHDCRNVRTTADVGDARALRISDPGERLEPASLRHLQVSSRDAPVCRDHLPWRCAMQDRPCMAGPVPHRRPSTHCRWQRPPLLENPSVPAGRALAHLRGAPPDEARAAGVPTTWHPTKRVPRHGRIRWGRRHADRRRARVSRSGARRRSRCRPHA
jgi:hypothetical protein